MKKLIKELLDHYIDVLEKYKKDPKYAILVNNEVTRGICYCSLHLFGTAIYYNSFMLECAKQLGKDEQAYWYPCTKYNKTVEQNCKCLQARIIYMQQMLEDKPLKLPHGF